MGGVGELDYTMCNQQWELTIAAHAMEAASCWAVPATLGVALAPTVFSLTRRSERNIIIATVATAHTDCQATPVNPSEANAKVATSQHSPSARSIIIAVVALLATTYQTTLASLGVAAPTGARSHRLSARSIIVMALAILATTCQLTLAGRGCSCANGELLATPGLALLGGASWRWSQMPLVTNQWPEDQRY